MEIEEGKFQLSDYEEKVYNLEGIDLQGYFVCFEENVNYIYSDDGFYLEIQKGEEFKKFIKIDNDNKPYINDEEWVVKLTEVQVKEIIQIFNDNESK